MIRELAPLGVPFTGEGRTYRVSGDLELPTPISIENATFVRDPATPGLSRRVLAVYGLQPPSYAESLRLENITIRFDGTPTQGAYGEDSAIRISRVRNVLLEDIEVTGNGSCTGIFVHDCDVVQIVRPYVHDMIWQRATDPGGEQITGVWIIQCNSTVISEPLITRLRGAFHHRGKPQFLAWQTDGIAVSACGTFEILGGTINECSEGIGISGDAGNRHFVIANLTVVDCTAYGIKLANSAFRGVISGCVTRSCSIAGFAVSGRCVGASPKVRDILFTGCSAFDIHPPGITWWDAGNNPSPGSPSTVPAIPDPTRTATSSTSRTYRSASASSAASRCTRNRLPGA